MGKPKFLIHNFKPIIFITLIVGGIMVALFILLSPKPAQVDVTPQVKFAFDIKPEFDLNVEQLECLSDPRAFVVEITKPRQNSTTDTAEDLDIKANYQFDCFEVKDRDLKISWFLDSQQIIGFDSLSETISEIAIGRHQVKILIKYGSYKAEDTVNFTIVPPNQPPIADIDRPSNGAQYNLQVCSMAPTGAPTSYCARISMGGRGNDPEDGSLGGAKMKWYRITNGVKTYLGSGISLSDISFPGQTCGSMSHEIQLEATDSKGLTDTDKITIYINHVCLY
jgi:hypothetical protein